MIKLILVLTCNPTGEIDLQTVSEMLKVAKNLEALNVWNQFLVHFEITNRCNCYS